jgi:hypothetical protein
MDWGAGESPCFPSFLGRRPAELDRVNVTSHKSSYQPLKKDAYRQPRCRGSLRAYSHFVKFAWPDLVSHNLSYQALKKDASPRPHAGGVSVPTTIWGVRPTDLFNEKKKDAFRSSLREQSGSDLRAPPITANVAKCYRKFVRYCSLRKFSIIQMLALTVQPDKAKW